MVWPGASGWTSICAGLAGGVGRGAGAVSPTATPPVTVLRDYHAENIMLLDRPGLARLGLLDFQDALAGHPAYDLVSLLQDARRDVSPALEAAMLARYVAEAGIADVDGISSRL